MYANLKVTTWPDDTDAEQTYSAWQVEITEHELRIHVDRYDGEGDERVEGEVISLSPQVPLLIEADF